MLKRTLALGAVAAIVWWNSGCNLCHKKTNTAACCPAPAPGCAPVGAVVAPPPGAVPAPPPGTAGFPPAGYPAGYRP